MRKKARFDSVPSKQQQHAPDDDPIEHFLRISEKDLIAEEDRLLLELKDALNTLRSHRRRRTQQQQQQQHDGQNDKIQKRVEVVVHDVDKTNTSNPNSNNKNAKKENDVDCIPGVINNAILLLHPDNASSHFRPKASDAMMELILTIIIEFVEPYLLPSSSSQGKKKEERTTTSTSSAHPEKSSSSKKETTTTKEEEAYKEHAISWAIDRIQCLIRPSQNTDIPELDALLASTGTHDGLAHDRIMQNMIFSSVSERSIHCDLEGGMEKKRKHWQKELMELMERVHAMNDEDNGGDTIPNTSYKSAEGIDIKSTTFTDTERWTYDPVTWFAELQNTNVDDIHVTNKNNNNEDGDDDAEEIGLVVPSLHSSNRMDHFPFLGHMRDFLDRHQIDEESSDPFKKSLGELIFSPEL